MRTFHIGDKVHWSSQSAGRWKAKDGVVVAKVQAGEVISSALQRLSIIPKINLAFDAGPSARAHESYIVDVNGTLYWPRASLLWLDGESDPHKVSDPGCKFLAPGPACDCQQCQFRKQCAEYAKSKGDLDALVAAVERYEAIDAEYAPYRDRDRVNEPKGTLDEADRLAGLSMKQDKIVREAAIAFVRRLGRDEQAGRFAEEKRDAR
jgi:hypothetical protein